MHHVLFVDDAPLILQTNQSYFTSRGYRVSAADNAADALELVQENEFDCIVMGVQLPNGEDGFQLCRKLRRKSSVPILFLTCHQERDFLYRSFASGGDDFLQKPYDLHELYLRVEARIRLYRGQPLRKDVLLFPPLRIDMTCRQVWLEEKLVRLTGAEFDILALLGSQPNCVLSPDEIYAEVWKRPSLDAAHIVQVHISHLRKKLGKNWIQTVWGKGYLFAPLPSEEA